MFQQSPHHISALDFDAFVRSFERQLRQTEAPRARLQLIVEFLSDASTVPESWLASYTETFLPHVLQLVRMPGMEGLPPEPWQLLLATCDQARRLDWLADADDLARARTAILEHLALCFGFLGALRQLDAALFSEGLTAAPLSEADWTDIFASGTTPWQLFDTYVDRSVHARPEAEALLDRTRERPQIIVEEIHPMDVAVRDFTSSMLLTLPDNTGKTGEALREILLKHKGNCAVQVNVRPACRNDVYVTIDVSREFFVQPDRTLMKDLEDFLIDQNYIRLRPKPVPPGRQRKGFQRKTPQGQAGPASEAVTRFN